MSPELLAEPAIEYPCSDGAPLGENTRQVQCILGLYAEFFSLFHGRDDVFVAADLFWYPVAGKPKVVHAPDILVAHGRPAGHRLSYKQWEEGGVAPQAVIEVMSPSDKPKVRARKLAFYDTHGALEYFEFDEEKNLLRGWTRTAGGPLAPLPTTDGYFSPWLGVRLHGGGGRPVQFVPPGGKPFRHLHQFAADAQATAVSAQREAAEKARADALAARLRALGHDPDA